MWAQHCDCHTGDDSCCHWGPGTLCRGGGLTAGRNLPGPDPLVHPFFGRWPGTDLVIVIGPHACDLSGHLLEFHINGLISFPFLKSSSADKGADKSDGLNLVFRPNRSHMG